jgi:transposase
VADADARKVVFFSKGHGADNIAGFVQHLRTHNGAADNITTACLDMSPAFIKGVTDHLPKAAITYDKFHVVAHASQAVDNMRRIEQRTDPALKGLRWSLLKDRSKLSSDQARPRSPRRPAHQAHRSRLALSRTIARHSRPHNRSTSFPRCWLSGAPTSCAPRSSP